MTSLLLQTLAHDGALGTPRSYFDKPPQSALTCLYNRREAMLGTCQQIQYQCARTPMTITQRQTH